jgi:enoyl-CoA hydratase/carnithine racemase
VKQFDELAIEMQGHVAVVEIQRPPYNFFSFALLRSLADAFEYLDNDPECRAIVLASSGKTFCAGADFSEAEGLFDADAEINGMKLYEQAVRLFSCKKTVVGAIHGAAIGGGLGLALVPDFRVVCPETRLAANFVQLGVHAGFGLTFTLPRLIGEQKASLLLCSGRRINGEQAYAWGMAEVLTTQNEVRAKAIELATEIAVLAPLAVESTKATLRIGFIDQFKQQVQREFAEQTRLAKTADHQEGKLSVKERRPGNFNRN